MTRFVFALLLGLSLASGAWAAQADYSVGAQDVLTISVYDQPEMSGKFKVESDGTFTFPLIGRVAARGQTLRAIETELKKRLSDGYLRNPQVTVAVETYQSQRIFVMGEVRSPGSYSLTGDMTLIEGALARRIDDAAGERRSVDRASEGGSGGRRTGDAEPDGLGDHPRERPRAAGRVALAERVAEGRRHARSCRRRRRYTCSVR
jgi:polysaccharide export outer membrane protein